MIKKKKVKFSIPEYREKKDLYKEMGYREVDYREKGINCVVELEIETTREKYREFRDIERHINRQGPTFLPILLLVIVAFALLSIFTVYAARSIRDGVAFDIVGNALAFLLPAAVVLGLDVVYTSFYFKINAKITEGYSPTKEELIEIIRKIKNS